MMLATTNNSVINDNEPVPAATGRPHRRRQRIRPPLPAPQEIGIRDRPLVATYCNIFYHAKDF
jgi:hypothetical protein